MSQINVCQQLLRANLKVRLSSRLVLSMGAKDSLSSQTFSIFSTNHHLLKVIDTKNSMSLAYKAMLKEK